MIDKNVKNDDVYNEPHDGLLIYIESSGGEWVCTL